MSKPRLKQFVTASGKLGGGSVILAILLFSISIVEHIRNQNVAAYSLVFIAALFFCVGTYLAWSEERDQYEREVATNAKPDLQLELLAAFWDPTRIPGTNELQLNIYAYMRVTNLREPETLIKSGSLSLKIAGREYTGNGNDGDRTYNFISHNTPFRLGGDVQEDFETSTPVLPLISRVHSGMPLKRGIHTGGLVVFTLRGVEIPYRENSNILETTDIRLSLVDSFGDTHLLKIANLDISFGKLSKQ